MIVPTFVANLFLFGWIVSTASKFTQNIKGQSNIHVLCCGSCYGLQLLFNDSLGMVTIIEYNLWQYKIDFSNIISLDYQPFSSQVREIFCDSVTKYL